MPNHETGIQWTHVPGYRGETWNPTTGCTRVSPGCLNCYAEKLHNQRFAHNLRVCLRLGYLRRGVQWREALAAARRDRDPELLAPQYDRPFSEIQLLDDRRLFKPRREKAPRCYFVDSMTDLFHEEIPDAFLDRVFAVIATSPQHLFLILTKRPARMRAYMSDPRRWSRWLAAAVAMGFIPSGIALIYDDGPPDFLANVWLGVSAEDQERADERVADLLATPAARRFVSYEPALGPVDFTRITPSPAERINALSGTWEAMQVDPDGNAEWRDGGGPALDWLIVGGESGKGARGFDVEWARRVVEDCGAYGVSAFVKQLGAKPYQSPDRDNGTGYLLGLRDRKGGTVEEWPRGLNVRQFPLVIAGA